MVAGFEPNDFRTSFESMFLAEATVHAFSPQIETAAFQFFAHQGNDIRFRKFKLHLNGFERRFVFPSHFYDAIDVFGFHNSELKLTLKKRKWLRDPSRA